MSRHLRFNLTPITSDLASHGHEEPKNYKKNDGIRLLPTKPKDSFNSEFPSLL